MKPYLRGRGGRAAKNTLIRPSIVPGPPRVRNMVVLICPAKAGEFLGAAKVT